MVTEDRADSGGLKGYLAGLRQETWRDIGVAGGQPVIGLSRDELTHKLNLTRQAVRKIGVTAKEAIE